ncbi:MAG: PTS glucose transporter subunit IIA [Succinivibrionaceae bacterium]|nr:PTS glucose transporter subunit IIA [Succinivibrionaceae bacterium]
MSGRLLPLSKVPDPVISEEVIGEGVAISPSSGEILAPCDGEVVRLLATANALSLRTPEGVEVYLGFGIGATLLKGEGFLPRVEMGAMVKRGSPLVGLAPALLESERLKSQLCFMIIERSTLAKSGISNGRIATTEGDCVAGETPCLWLSLGDAV